jgi:DNA-binding MarR family transcriptional regulator
VPVASLSPSQAEATRELAESLVDAMSAVRRAVRREAGAVAEVASLSEAQLQLVRVVRRRPGVSVAEAAADLGVAPNTVSTLVHQLGSAGILERRPSPEDRRVARLYLRPPVAESLGEWVGRRSDAVATALARMADEDRDALACAVGPLARLAEVIGTAPQMRK